MEDVQSSTRYESAYREPVATFQALPRPRLNLLACRTVGVTPGCFAFLFKSCVAFCKVPIGDSVFLFHSSSVLISQLARVTSLGGRSVCYPKKSLT